MEAAVQTLKTYIESLKSIIYIPHFDFQMIDKLIFRLLEGQHIYEYHEGFGKVDFINKKLISDQSLLSFLSEFTTDHLEDSLIVLKDIHHHLRDPQIISRLKHIAFKNLYNNDFFGTVIIISSQNNIPSELEKFTTVFEVEKPSEEQIIHIIKGYSESLHFHIREEVVSRLANNLCGLNEFDIFQLLNQAYHHGGKIGLKDRDLFQKEKYEFIKKGTTLEFINSHNTLYDIGGLDELKSWLIRKSRIFKDIQLAKTFGVQIPKGLFLTGLPGTGKNLLVKATANLFEIPLFRLNLIYWKGKDPDSIEKQWAKVVQTVEMLCPCILWIDGIDSHANQHDDHAYYLSTILISMITDWLKIKDKPVFVIGTTNNLMLLPEVVLRERVFDDYFFIDLPPSFERGKIFEIHLTKYAKWNENIDPVPLINATEGYSGADIEVVVKNTIENLFINGKGSLTTEDLLETIKAFKPLAAALEKEIAENKKILQQYNFKLADSQILSQEGKLHHENGFDSDQSYQKLIENENYIDQYKPVSLEKTATLDSLESESTYQNEEHTVSTIVVDQDKDLISLLEETNQEENYPFSSDSLSSDWDLNGDYSTLP